MLYDPKYNFDELGDVAFAEIRVIMDRMERNKEIEVEDLSCEEMAYECKKLAHEFMEKYNAACELGEFPDFYDKLDTFTYHRLTVQFPPLKDFDVEIDVNTTLTRRIRAKDKAEAEKIARELTEMPGFDGIFRRGCRIYETVVGETKEVKENE